MACVVKRRGKWVVDYRDGAGVRRWESFSTREGADARLAEVIPEAQQKVRPAVHPNITLAEYTGRWLQTQAATIKHATLTSYEGMLRLHILPELGSVQLRRLQRAQIKALLTVKLRPQPPAAALSRGTVRLVQATLRAVLNAALEDGVIRQNPAARLGRQLKLVDAPAARQEQIKALNRTQLDRLLVAAANERATRRYAPLLLLLARTGMRVGEGLALQWQDIDFDAREIRIARAFSAGRLEETPKGGRGRTVDVSRQLAEALRALEAERKAEKLRRGWAEPPPWVFIMEAGTPLDASTVRRAFAKALTKAKLPRHFSPHSLRHSYASILLSEGVSPTYVQRQLGHASIKLTVDTYGKWLPMGNKAAVDGLDSRVVAETVKMVAADAPNPRKITGLTPSSPFVTHNNASLAGVAQR